jgi:hypothetical protein
MHTTNKEHRKRASIDGAQQLEQHSTNERDTPLRERAICQSFASHKLDERQREREASVILRTCAPAASPARSNPFSGVDDAPGPPTPPLFSSLISSACSWLIFIKSSTCMMAVQVSIATTQKEVVKVVKKGRFFFGGGGVKSHDTMICTDA